MFQRNERISELILQELSGLLRSIKDPGLSGLLTLTGIELSRDRKSARVFFSIIGSAEERKASSKALNRAAEHLRYQLRSLVDLKYIPQLEFLYDQTPERAERVERLLGQIEAERAAPSLPDTSPGDSRPRASSSRAQTSAPSKRRSR